LSIPPRLILRDRQLFNNVTRLAEQTVASNVPDLSNLERDEAGAALRRLATGSMTSFGAVATETSRISYQEMATGANVRGDYNPTRLPEFDNFIAREVDPAVGRSMKAYSQGLFVEAASFLSVTVARVVGNVYRETIASNARRDPRAGAYRRVAGPRACAFCAFAATRADIVTKSDAKFHANCRCTTIPAFKGQEQYKPTYYEKYEEDASTAEFNLRREQEAAREQFREENPDARNRDFFRAYPQLSITPENILAQMRAGGGYR